MVAGLIFGNRSLSVVVWKIQRSVVRAYQSDGYGHYRQGLSATVLDIIQRENSQTIKSFMNTDSYQTVYQEITRAAQWVQESSSMVPEVGPTGQYRYFWKQPPQQQTVEEHSHPQSPIYYRFAGNTKKQGESPTAVLPTAVLEAKSPVGSMSLSLDETLVAYHLLDDSENVHVRNIATGRVVSIPTLLPTTNSERVVSVEFGFTIFPDNAISLYWVTSTDHRPSTVYTCNLVVQKNGEIESSSSPPRLVYHADDTADFVHVQRCKGGTMVAIQAQSQMSNEIWLADCDASSQLYLVQKRQPATLYYVDAGDRDNVMVVMNNVVYETTLDHLPLQDDDLDNNPAVIQQHFKNWQTEYCIENLELFESFLAVFVRSTADGWQAILIQDRRTKEEWMVEQLFSGTITSGGNMQYHATHLVFQAMLPFEPSSTYSYNMRTRALKRLARAPPLGPDTGGGEHDCFEQKRVFVPSHDGTLVPLTLVHRKGLENDTSVFRCILMCYGAYGKPLDLSYDPTLQPLLDRGYALAFAHCRGGGDLGPLWHVRGVDKWHSIHDYLACAQYLHDQQQQQNDCSVQLTARAFSAGGVIVGAAVNQRPDLFHTVVLANAFLDVQATLHNRDLALTTHDWDEYGNPWEDDVVADTIASYCPVSNIKPSSGGRFLLLGTLDDIQVPFWNSLIYGMKLRDLGQARVNLFFELEGGHDWNVGRIHMAALQANFILRNAGQ